MHALEKFMMNYRLDLSIFAVLIRGYIYIYIYITYT